MNYSELAIPSINQIKPYQPGMPIEELTRTRNIVNQIIKLASNENSYGCSAKVKEKLNQKLNNIHHYPDGEGYYLKQAIAKKLSVDSKQLILGNGSNDILELVARGFVNAGSSENIVYSQYAFIVYKLLAMVLNIKAKEVIADENYGHNLDTFLSEIDSKTKVIFIANPNNPTGTFIQQNEIIDFLKKVPQNIIVVLDCAYDEYLDLSESVDIQQILNTHSGVIISKTFSKAYGLAGLRIGYGITHPEIADLINRIRQPFNTNFLAQEAAQVALEDSDYIDFVRSKNAQSLILMSEYFKTKNINYITSKANFISAQFENVQQVYDKMLDEGIILRSNSIYQMPEYLRISMGTQDQNQRLIETFEKIL